MRMSERVREEERGEKKKTNTQQTDPIEVSM
jgi:hypothetical protein